MKAAAKTKVRSLFARHRGSSADKLQNPWMRETVARLRSNDGSLTELDLRHNGTGDEGVRALADALKDNSTLTVLNLWHNQIGEEGVRALADALKDNSTLRKLDLGENQIGEEGARALADALKENTSLTELNLGYIRIGDEGVRALADALKENSTLAVLNLRHNGIKEEGARALADALKENTTLTELNLWNNKIGEEGARAFADALKENTTLTKLYLGHNQIGIEGGRALVDALKENTTLTELNLWNNKIGEEGARALADALKDNEYESEDSANDSYSNKSVSSPGVAWHGGNERIGNEEFSNESELENVELREAVARLRSNDRTLTSLDLRRRGIADAGARALACALKENSALTELILGSNKIGVEGACKLAEAMKENTTLTCLDLSLSKFGTEGTHALAEALKQNSTLTELWLAGNQISAEGGRALADALKENITLTTLDLKYNNTGPHALAHSQEMIRRNNSLQSHKDEIKRHGVSFYFMTNDVANNGTDLVSIKETVWKQAATFDGLLLELVGDVLKKHLAGYTSDALNVQQRSLKKMFDEDRNSEGSPLLHLAAALDSKGALNLCQLLVDEIGVDFDTISDQLGRTARDIAQGNARTSKWAKSTGTFLGRYRLEEKGRYKSTTCTVHFAIDVGRPKGNPDREVAIKIMDNPEQFERELGKRLKEYSQPQSGVDIDKSMNCFDEDHVVPLLRYHKTEVDGKFIRCLVMPKGQRNMDEVISYEGIAGRDINAITFFAIDMAKALQHIHNQGNGIIHGDFKPRNIVRIHGDYKLIDFDASVKIGGELTEKFSSGYMPPEVAKVIFRPNESEEELHRTAEDLQEQKKQAFEDDDDDALSEILSKLEKVKGDIKNFKPGVLKKPKADARIDVWSYAVVLHKMLTHGRRLFDCDSSNDSLTDEIQKRKLANWEGITDSDLKHVLKDCDNQDVAELAKDLLRKCLSPAESRLTSFSQVLKHPFLSRQGKQTEHSPEGHIASLSTAIRDIRKDQQEIKKGQQEIKRIQKMMVLKLDQTLSMLHEMETHLQNVSKMMRKIHRNFAVPKLLFVVPVGPSRKDWNKPSTWVNTRMKVIFVCPVTYSIPRDSKNKPMGYTIKMPKDWAVKYGPALRLSFEVLQIAFAVGRLACLPLPNLSSFGESPNPFQIMNDDLVEDLGENVPDLTGLADAARKEKSISSEITESMTKSIKASYDQVKRLGEGNHDPDFLKTGLAKVEKDECVEYVLNDPKVKTIYQENGHVCVGLPIEKLRCLGADLDIVVKEGELEKNINNEHKQANFINKKASQGDNRKQRYYVLRKSGLLTYYPSKEERDKDPLGASGKIKPKKVVSVENAENDCFEISYEDDESKQTFNVPLDSGQELSSTRELANAWVQAWANKANAHLTD